MKNTEQIKKKSAVLKPDITNKPGSQPKDDLKSLPLAEVEKN